MLSIKWQAEGIGMEQVQFEAKARGVDRLRPAFLRHEAEPEIRREAAMLHKEGSYGAFSCGQSFEEGGFGPHAVGQAGEQAGASNHLL